MYVDHLREREREGMRKRKRDEREIRKGTCCKRLTILPYRDSSHFSIETKLYLFSSVQQL